MIGNERYTMTLYEIINNFFTREEVEGWFKDYELSDYLTSSQIDVIEEAGIWNKNKLARKIVDHFLMEQIGFETFGLFKHHAKVKMQELMESKLPLIYSASIEYDPLVNVDFTESFERTIENEGNSSGLSVGSDTPQGQISKASILAGDYATDTSASENEATNNTDENYTKTVKGNSGVSATAQRMIQQYRENIYAIDNSIIDELNELFMCIY